MKSPKLTCLIAFVSLALLPIQLQVLAQEQEKPQIHYRLIDMGTFGGPASYVNIPDAYAQVLNNRGMVAGSADTPAPDPYPSFCFNEDCFVSHAFESHSGILRDLGVLPGGASSGANWISTNGLIIGESQNGTIDPLIPGFPELHAVFWNHGNIVDLRTLEGGNESIANSVNTRGQIVGWSLNGIPDAFSITGLGYQTRAFVWQKGVMQDLGTLGGPDAMANLVNESGQIVGESYTNSTPSSYCAENLGLSLTTGAFLWQNGKMFNLGGFGGTCTFASDLNNRGQVVGTSTLTGDLAQHPFLWDRTAFTDLGTFGGSRGNAIAINDAGEAVGWAAYPGDEVFHASLWKNGRMTDLGTINGDPLSFAFTINGKGDVAGSSANGDFSQFRAFLWHEGGPMVDLNTLIPGDSDLFLTVPETINDRGEIAGIGLDPNGNQHAFLLIPCDEHHSSVEGCEYNMVDEAAATRERPAPAMQMPAGAIQSNSVRQMLRQRLGLRYHIPGPTSGARVISGPNVTLSPTSLTFSTQAIDTMSAAKTVTLKNTGTASLTISSIAITGTDAGDFSQATTCGASLAAGASCKISVKFKPTVSGTRTAAVSITDSAAGSPQQVPLSGIGTTAKLSPTTLSFGTVAIDTASPAKTVTLTNVGTTTFTITAIAITGTNAGDFTQTHTCGSLLTAGASCTVRVTFKPTQIGKRTGTLSVTDNAPGSPQKVTLSGIGTTAELSPTSLDFGFVAVGTTSPAKTVTLTNVGTTTLSITGIAITGTNAGDFAETHTCGSSLAAGASCTVSVTFRPSATGRLSGTLSVTDNAPGSPQTVSLSGTGAASGCRRGGMECDPFHPCCPGLTCQFRGPLSFCESKTLDNTSSTSPFWDKMNANKLE